MSTVPKAEKVAVPIIDIDENDENGTIASTGTAMNGALNESMQSVELQQQQTLVSNSAPSVSNNRSFWKAGDYVVGPSSKPSPDQGYLEHARVHPKFLHSNATSHKWAFGEGVFLIAMEGSCKESERWKSALVARRVMEPSLVMEEVEGVHTSHVAKEEAIDGKPTWEKQWIFGPKIAIFCNYGPSMVELVFDTMLGIRIRGGRMGV